MRSTSQTRDPVLPRWVAVLWTAVVSLAMVAYAGPAQANHYSVDRHNHNIHYNTTGTGPGQYDEQFCAESHDTAKVSNSSARSFVNQTLTQMGAGKVWDGLGDYRIDLWVTNNNCTAYDPATRATIELEYHYGWDWSGICGGSTGYYNCVVHDKPVWNPDYGHSDFAWEYTYLVFSSGGQLNDRGRAFINHESGHMFGLLDPAYSGDCRGPSIMHSSVVGYGCTNWTNWYPSPADFASVLTVMNGG